MKTLFQIIKNYKGTVFAVLAMAFGLCSFFYGAHVERLEANEEIALLEKSYAERERDAYRKAEAQREAQAREYIAQIDRLKRDADRLTADALRVRGQFEQLKSRRSADIEQCNDRAQRCERLLSEAYELAREGEELLRERDARLSALSAEKFVAP